MYCPECGLPQSEANRFCPRCGALLPHEGRTGETTGPFTVPDADGEGSGPLSGVTGPALAVRTGGGLSGEVFLLGPEQMLIGRGPDCDIFLDDITVSRHHATVRVDEAGVLLQDLGSLNGTYVNRRRIDVEERLVDGDELQVGKFRLAFVE